MELMGAKLVIASVPVVVSHQFPFAKNFVR